MRAPLDMLIQRLKPEACMLDASVGHYAEAASVSSLWISDWSHLVRLSDLKGFPTNRPKIIREQTTQGLERRFVWKEKSRCAQDQRQQFLHKEEEKKKLTTIYGKFNSTAKIKSTSKINSSTIRQISWKGFQVTDKRKNKKHFTFYKLKIRESNSGDNSSIEEKPDLQLPFLSNNLFSVIVLVCYLISLMFFAKLLLNLVTALYFVHLHQGMIT